MWSSGLTRWDPSIMYAKRRDGPWSVNRCIGLPPQVPPSQAAMFTVSA
jgi:hypothetical protein